MNGLRRAALAALLLCAPLHVTAQAASAPAAPAAMPAGVPGLVAHLVRDEKFIDIALSPTGLSVTQPGKFAKLVDRVEHVTFSGNRARAQGQEVLYVTERCVIRLTEKGLVATEIMPGIDPARDIVAASGGRVALAENATLLPLSLLGKGPMGWQP